ncbi:ABC transporter B family member 29, chloroplastic isoform X1 [Elaeis guineensis]|uniref:ABC transporter B family member 29, chloroplastic n=1 Tax=Elaeis guineensis var. tenera TaxID=51953 RepID=A0A6I9RSA0_ELAGV|nr:ABC transporter B family member 29, chloroplastic [Elaeis guineensis]
MTAMFLRAPPPSPLLSSSSSSFPLVNPLSTRIPSSFLAFLCFKTLTMPPPRSARTHLSRFVFPNKTSPFSPLFSIPNPQESHCRALPFTSSSPLFEIAPFIQSEWEPILKGWICSAVSVYCLSSAIPRVGRFPSAMAAGIGSNRMVREGLALAALAGARSVTGYLQQAFLWEAALRSVYRIRVHVFDRVLQRDLGFFEGNDGVPAGDIAYRITAEASDVADTVYALLNTVVPNTLQVIAMATQMVVVSPALSFMAALAIPCTSFIIAYLGQRLREISRNAHLSVARLSAYLNEVVPSILAVKANNGELKESMRFQMLSLDDLEKLLRKRKMKALMPQIVQALYIGGLLLFCAGSLVVSKNSFDASGFLSFIMALTLLIEPVQDVGKAYNELKQGEPAIERLFDLTRFKSKVIEKPDAVDLDSITGDIKFCGVTFRYADNMPPVLNGLDLHIKPGERVALVGPSGGGKTTLTKLLLRLYDPHCGCILVDNHDIQDIQLKSLREHIVLVSQDIMLFSGTVAENIGYRDLIGKVNMEQVENAARISNADEFIATLSDGYKTNIGQRGSLLSGGQKQRLAIARALYRKSSVLILDEATSALDSKSELLVRQALERMMANHTVLIIAHRLDTILMADRVLLLDRGKLEEVSKSSLLAQDGQHASLALNSHRVSHKSDEA